MSFRKKMEKPFIGMSMRKIVRAMIHALVISCLKQNEDRVSISR
jgi:hypothetical protein